MGSGEFEGQTLAGLHAMLAGADPAKLANAGNALGDAGPKITEIGTYLKRHATRVEWRGDGADNFREWASYFALEVTRLGQFTGAVGSHMINAGQALTEAKASVPKPVDAEKAHGDPDADKAHIADGTIKLQQAIHQMERLSSYYRAAKEDLEAEREPEFKPLPSKDPVDLPERAIWPNATSPTTSAPRVELNGRPESASVHGPNGNASIPVVHGVDPGGGPSRRVGMDIDAVDGLPHAVRDSPQYVPPSTEPTGPSAQPFPMAPARTAPVGRHRGPSLPELERTSASRMPDAGSTGPVQPIVRASKQTPSTPGVSGGYLHNPNGSLGQSRLPRGLVMGEERAPLARGAMTGSPSGAGGAPTAGGIPGNRRSYEPGSPSGGPQARGSETPSAAHLQRGVVAGEERGASALTRGPISGAAGGIPAGPPGGMRGPDGGRRGQGLAIEPGGTVADRRTGSPSRADFTPGGAGLVRGSTIAPATRQRAQRPPQPTRLERTDEGDVWPLGRDTVPPVVE
ncbi:hypothetical protein FHS42_007134 [Streptomyces zagrosensis]|uniref:Uncharacterized protein n=1 Tax=Streptomyces zagrosensis TaxID=1042984 RepID=A0A7W9V388_9ACTN|nr:hypothetical protein [Streptomyces zagrosensis]